MSGAQATACSPAVKGTWKLKQRYVSPPGGTITGCPSPARNSRFGVQGRVAGAGSFAAGIIGAPQAAVRLSAGAPASSQAISVAFSASVSGPPGEPDGGISAAAIFAFIMRQT